MARDAAGGEIPPEQVVMVGAKGGSRVLQVVAEHWAGPPWEVVGLTSFNRQ